MTASAPLRLWSATTLLKLGLGTSDPLVNWNVKTACEYAVDNTDAWMPLAKADRDAAVKVLMNSRWAASDKAKARGTDLHKAAEQMALGVIPKVEEHILPYLMQYQAFLDQFQPEFVMAEAPVYNPEVGYAGTLDGVLKIGGRTVVADIKTTPHAPDSGKSRPPYSEVALQLTAYKRATHVGVMSEQRYAAGKRYYLFDPDAQHEPMPETDGAVCIVVSPFDFMVVPVRTDEQTWRHFRHCMENARWQVDVSRNVFGPPITAPTSGVAA